MKIINNNKFYKNSFKKYGVNAKGVHWESKLTQFKRFEVLTSFIINEIENSSLADIGCGFGAYLDYLKRINISPKSYLGVDCEDFILDISKKKYKENSFIKCDILNDNIPRADYLICSGTLNILNQIKFFEAVINCFNACNKGFLFNFLTKNNIHHISEEYMYNFCKGLTPKISIKKNYLNNDCSIYLEKLIS